ncbi:chromosome segregation protein SMC [Candidatus Thiodiazotropha endoloripes]|uniref:chromosome segregation protein SMC n=1 Tax=Candidatus Thiodiazotropha endoloripes TaxID=1818881 RepID=UPI00083D4C10|nr:chromosome segregation protein SMC [Candidatus Thiodiazotropha endoloripes]ODB86417.1 chromosome segregation protein SMC [Candidatus Thiodiazotropha endoloripes]ODB88447.1 chromosome segregation protein SMC [Candidatus Thiodiazotropha endoloripes]
MRLEKIKLAGFKSFVDPTTVPIPSNLVGVVGPNGCGKSNVIDAVRWVMGESSAKMLRGESMADVIFNGSSARKPVGAATIELLFDNAEGRAGGQYAQYNQISVKRQVSRDGQSLYYLNGVRCRRRDITDLFLGTGLGPRSYSIIEQGMISRLIEARPEDLRTFLEEAAGISKYKERRRETENRIRHTRENLERLTDLRDEVAKQLQHLQRQAATAEKYQTLKQEERQTKAELLALRWRTLDQDLQQRQRNIAELQNHLEAALAEQRKLESVIEEDREKHTEANDLFNEVQGRFYSLGAEISGLEQAIQFARDTQKQQQQDLEQVEQAFQESEAHRAQDETRLNELNKNLQTEEPLLMEAREDEHKLSEALNQSEQAMQSWQAEWEQFNQQAAEPAQTAQVERTRINHLEQQGGNLERRLQRFDEELSRLDDSRLLGEIGELEAEESGQKESVDILHNQLSEMVEQINQQRELNNQQANQLDQARAELQSNKGRQASLEALQQAALGEAESDIAEWLETTQLQSAQRLAQQIKVTPRWQQAVEVVLGFHLQAVCIDNLDQLNDALPHLEKGTLTLWEGSAASTTESHAEELATQIEAPWSLQNLLAGVRMVDDLQTALHRRHSLNPGESLITPEGIWLGRNWLRITRESDERAGVLGREEELRILKQTLEEQQLQVDELTEQLEQGRERLKHLEQEREQSQANYNQLNRALSEVRSNLSSKRTRADHLRQRREQLQQEQQEIAEQIENDHLLMEETRQRLHLALEAIETLGSRRESLVQRRDELRTQVTEAREKLNQQRTATHQRELQVESMRTVHTSLTQNLQRARSQLEQLTQRRNELKQSLESAEAPMQQQLQDLNVKLEARSSVEQELNQVRQGLEDVDGHLREKEQQRHQAEQQVQQRRDKLNQAQLQNQEVSVRRNTLQEQLDEGGLVAEELFKTMPEDAGESVWQQKVETLANRIQRLGPINLAAIDEFQEQSERLKYLEEQHADITSSLETLENAIRKIDRETRTRFKETFDKVNSGIKDLFPRLFGGGHAYLELTGEDLLDTGVTVMARPPGKRNASIHLLSGGEKALTAVALVFSIFQLNPAPFCMLDEVDAPLDDANVGRFCEMVKSMSDQVQFIFITHNKITMEIANQLSGVTMHEPGVSRLVTVDVEEAAQLAAL